MYLEHHGILGMHWGIRRYQNKDGSLTAEGIKRYRTDLKFKSKYDRQQAKREAKRANEVKTKSIKELSDEELRERIQRLELEKRVIDLERAINGGSQGQNNNQNQPNKDKVVQQSVSFGKKFVGEIGKSVTKMAVGYASKKIFDAITGGLDKAERKQAGKVVKEMTEDIKDSVKTSDKKKSDPVDVINSYSSIISDSKMKNGSSGTSSKNYNKPDKLSKKSSEPEKYGYNQLTDFDVKSNLMPRSDSVRNNVNTLGTYNSGRYDYLVDVGQGGNSKVIGSKNYQKAMINNLFSDVNAGAWDINSPTFGSINGTNAYLAVNDLLKEYGNMKV